MPQEILVCFYHPHCLYFVFYLNLSLRQARVLEIHIPQQNDYHLRTWLKRNALYYQEIISFEEGNTRNKNMEIKVSKTFDTNNSPRGVDHYQEIQHNQKIPNNNNNNQIHSSISINNECKKLQRI